MRTGGWRAGAEAVGRIVNVENHDAAYFAWRDTGVRQRTLIHVDAHHDMWWVDDPRNITIANFISRALAEDIVREVVWVVPDGTWDGRRGRRSVLRHLRRLTSCYPGVSGSVRIEKSTATAVVLGKRLTVCSLDSLPPVDETVLLDIDVDFCVIPRVSFSTRNEHTALPWCWPEQLVAGLRTAAVTTDFVTIAYSVEGGYTPLKWKYLGDELTERLAHVGGGTPGARGMQLMREAASANARGERLAAGEQYRQAAAMLGASAAPFYHLADLAIETGQGAEARSLYQRALEIDASYRTPFSGGGFVSYWDGYYRQAEQEFRRVLMLDPGDPFAQLGLAMLAVKRKRWDEAAELLETALAADGTLVEGHRALGRVLAHQRRPREAIAAYERSLRLTLAGHRPILSESLTDTHGGRLVDPDHCAVHARLAALYAAEGDTARAITGYTISIAGGHDAAGSRARLAWLHLARGDWRSALTHVGPLVKACPRHLRNAGHRLARAWRTASPQSS